MTSVAALLLLLVAGSQVTVVTFAVPNARIVLGHGTLECHYHGADGAEPFWCQFLE